MFALKAIMKETPYTFISVSIGVSIVLFGYCLKVFDGPLSEVSGQNFNLMRNCMWNVIITMTTTGYGDIYPKSDFGRVVGMLICFWGTTIVSFFVVTVNNMLTFEGSEGKSFNTLLRLRFKDQLKIHAANVLNSAFKQKLVKTHHPDDKGKNYKAMTNLRAKMINFKLVANHLKSYYDGDTEMEILMKHLDILKDEVQVIKFKQDNVDRNLASVVNFIGNLNHQLAELMSFQAATYKQVLLPNEVKSPMPNPIIEP